MPAGRTSDVRHARRGAARGNLLLGLLLIALGSGGTLLWMNRDRFLAPKPPPAPPLTPAQKEAQGQLKALLAKENAMREILQVKIPQFEAKLKKDLSLVIRDYDPARLGKESSGVLEREYTEIERSLAALKDYRAKCEEAMTIIASAHRGLDRLIQQDSLTEHDTFIDQAQKAEQFAGSLMEIKLTRAEMLMPARPAPAAPK